jgi:hypothetical protein
VTTILVDDKSLNLDLAISFYWTDSDDEMYERTGCPVKAVRIVYAFDGGKAIGHDVTDPQLARIVWHYDCAHRVKKGGL